MKIFFYNKRGRSVAFSEDGEHIYLFTGEPVAYLEGSSIYTFNGKHLGWFDNGWVKDHDGKSVFFTDTALGGPIKPLITLKPEKCALMPIPFKRMKWPRPIRKPDRLVWSDKSLEFFSEMKPFMPSTIRYLVRD